MKPPIFGRARIHSITSQASAAVVLSITTIYHFCLPLGLHTAAHLINLSTNFVVGASCYLNEVNLEIGTKRTEIIYIFSLLELAFH